MGEEGFEEPPISSGNTAFSQTSGAESGAVGAESDAGWHLPTSQADDELKLLIELWSVLPSEIRAGIMLIASRSGSH